MARKGGKDRGIFPDKKDPKIWWARYIDQFGKDHKEKVGPKALAKKVYEKRKTEIREGRFFPKAKPKPVVLVRQVLEDYRKSKEDEGKSPESGHMAYNRILERFGDGPANELTRTAIEEWLHELLKGLSPSRVNKHLTILKAAYNLALRKEPPLVERNPCFRIKSLTENNKRTRVLSEEEEKVLFDAISDEHKALPLTALHTGLRRSELFRLRLEDLDFYTRMINVRKSKSGEGRQVPMNELIYRVLYDLRTLRIRQAKKQGLENETFSPLVFCASGGGDLGHNFDSRVWQPALEKAKLVDFHFHDLRHTFASRLVMNGVALYEVSKLLGHKNIKTTERYSHFAPGYLKKAVSTLVPEPTKPRNAGRGKPKDRKDSSDFGSGSTVNSGELV